MIAGDQFDMVARLMPGAPKFTVTFSCPDCGETWEAVQASPTKELLESVYRTLLARCPTNPAHTRVSLKVEEAPGGTQSHGPRRVA